ncbi:MAG TPA: substrate-binding domain-containing protein [Burkholderiales bacterium]
MRIIGLMVLLFLSGTVFAEEINVLSGGAAKSFIDPLAASFSPHSVKIEYQPMGRLTKMLAEGAVVDMIVVTSEVAENLRLQGKPIARVGIGVAVNEKAPSPDISTPEALKRTLLAAKSVVYIDPKTGTSGKHVFEMIKKLNIENEMQPKTHLGQGGYVTEPVGRGEIELGIHQISEILPVKGVKLVGPLPPALQKYTVYVAVNLKDKPSVAEFISYLGGPQAQARLAQAGYTSPE